jgi:hypothetical protein
MTWTKQVSTIPAHKNIAAPEVLTKFAFHRGFAFIGSLGQGRFAHRKSGPWSPTETAWNRATVRKSPSALNSRGWNLQLPKQKAKNIRAFLDEFIDGTAARVSRLGVVEK